MNRYSRLYFKVQIFKCAIIYIGCGAIAETGFCDPGSPHYPASHTPVFMNGEMYCSTESSVLLQAVADWTLREWCCFYGVYLG